MKLKDLTFERVKMVGGNEHHSIESAPGHETYLHAISGHGFAYMEGRSDGVVLDRRFGVFEPPGSGYLFGGEKLVVFAGESLDLVVVRCPVQAPTPDEPVMVTPKAHIIGSGPARRTVYEILGGGGPSQRIRFGETVNARGGWSSWPGHSFDKQPELAPQFEEAFLCFTRPRDGYGLIRLSGTYHDGFECDGARIVRSGDMFQVPLGTHPIVGAPDTDLMYVWAYLSPVDKIYGQWAEDRGTYL